MSQNIDLLTGRFDKALMVMRQNLGPQVIQHAHSGLTPAQVFMLHFIRQGEHCSVSKLADKMEVNPSAITVMLDRLVNHGFVVRERDQHDRRVVLIHLTKAGEEALSQVTKVRKEIMQHCLRQITVDELETVVLILEKLASASAAMDIPSIIGIENHLEG